MRTTRRELLKDAAALGAIATVPSLQKEKKAMPAKKGSIVRTSGDPVHVGDAVTFALDFGKYGDAYPAFGFADCRIVDPQSDVSYAGGPSNECYVGGWQIGCPEALTAQGLVSPVGVTAVGRHVARIYNLLANKSFDHPIDKIEFDVI